MTTPDRRFLALASVLLLLLQAVPASALCHCESPCGPSPERAAVPDEDSCCRQESAAAQPSFEGVCCMAGGPDLEVPTSAALLAPIGLDHDGEGSRQTVQRLGSFVEQSGPGSRIPPRSAPPSPPPIFLLTVSFLN